MLSELAALSSSAHISGALILGLLVGSFLNVVIYRLPKLMQYQWSAQSHEWLNDEPYDQTPPDGLVTPASRCGNCGSGIKPWQNIPIVSFMLLGAKCANCKQAISWRYPTVELLTGVLSALVIHQFGWSSQAFFGLILTWALVCLSFIDYDHKLLPDDIVLPTMWLGLLLSISNIYTNPVDSIIGAIAGYMTLWLTFQLFKLLTGKEGMGYGDFKLLALLGAWLGWQYLPQVLLLSTIAGSLIGLTLIALKKSSSDQTIPFGPYIALAGWIAFMWGNQINQAYLNYSGLG